MIAKRNVVGTKSKLGGTCPVCNNKIPIINRCAISPFSAIECPCCYTCLTYEKSTFGIIFALNILIIAAAAYRAHQASLLISLIAYIVILCIAVLVLLRAKLKVMPNKNE